MIPYGRQWIDEEDIAEVVRVLKSDWLTTGPAVETFEKAVGTYLGVEHAVAVSSGTAALHAAMFAIGIGPGDEVIVPPMTFAATANAVLYQRGTPVFVDVDPGTLNLDPELVEKKITPRTKAIVAVDYAGQPCEYDRLRAIAKAHGLKFINDASHAIGAEDRGRKVGTLADLTIFSFHPVKHITTGEGGMITTNDADLAARMRRFRNHGINSDHRQREKQNSWFYEMEDLGFNYRITDFQCALGTNQLTKLPTWLERRSAVARQYDEAFSGSSLVRPLKVRSGVRHAYHLYVVRLSNRDRAFTALRAAGIGVNVHYVPVHLHPFYKRTLGTAEGLCPVAESAYREVLSIPMYPKITDQEVQFVVSELKKAAQI